MKENKFTVDCVEVNLARSMALANHLIDSDMKKLSDKLKNTELSHNRKKKALKQILNLVSHNDFDVIVADMILDICERALFSDGKVKGVF